MSTEDNSKKNSVLVQAGILAAASMIVRVIGVLYRAPLTAIIGDEGNGYYGTAYNIYTIILMVSSYSIPSAISKLMAQKLAVQNEDGAQKVFHCALLYGLIVGACGSALLYFGAALFVPSVAVCVLKVFAPTVFLFGILGSLRGYFQARGSMVQTSISQILEQLAHAVVGLLAAWFLMRFAVSWDYSKSPSQLGAMGAAMGTGAGVVTALIFMLFCYIRDRKKEKKPSAASQQTFAKENHFGEIFKETILVITPFMLSGVILNLTTSLNQTIYMNILIRVQGMAETAATTIYGVFSNKAVVITNVPISIASAVSSAIIPGISAAYARKDREDTIRRSREAIGATALIAIPAAIGLFVLARPITMVLFPQMETLPLASSLLRALSVTVIFYSISTVCNAILQSIGKMHVPLVSAGIAIVIQTIVLVVLLLYSHWDVEALVICSIIYSVMIFIIDMICLNRFLQYKQDVRKSYLYPFLCALIMGAAAFVSYEFIYWLVSFVGSAYFRNAIALVPSIIIAVFVYAFALLKSKTVGRETLLHFPKGKMLVRICEKLHLLPKEG